MFTIESTDCPHGEFLYPATTISDQGMFKLLKGTEEVYSAYISQTGNINAICLPSDTYTYSFTCQAAYAKACILLVTGESGDENNTVASYIPELANSGFGDARVKNVLEMSTAIAFSENYNDPNSDIWKFSRAGNVFRGPDYDGPGCYYEYLPLVKKQGGRNHGEVFGYKTVNTAVLGWIISRVTGKGRLNGIQSIPKKAVQDITKGGDPRAFEKSGEYPELRGWSYRNMWWITHNSHKAYMARGVHGQAIYIDPIAEMVIARFASNPLSSNKYIDPLSLPAYEAVADYLLGC